MCTSTCLPPKNSVIMRRGQEAPQLAGSSAARWSRKITPPIEVTSPSGDNGPLQRRPERNGSDCREVPICPAGGGQPSAWPGNSSGGPPAAGAQVGAALTKGRSSASTFGSGPRWVHPDRGAHDREATTSGDETRSSAFCPSRETRGRRSQGSINCHRFGARASSNPEAVSIKSWSESCRARPRSTRRLRPSR